MLSVEEIAEKNKRGEAKRQRKHKRAQNAYKTALAAADAEYVSRISRTAGRYDAARSTPKDPEAPQRASGAHVLEKKLAAEARDASKKAARESLDAATARFYGGNADDYR